MNDCVFCSIIETNDPHHEIWWENATHVAFLDNTPTRRGHSLVVPRKHSENILDLESAEYSAIMLAAKDLAQILRTFFKVPRIAMITEGLSVNHIHVHLIPVEHKGDLGTFKEYVMGPNEFEILGSDLRTLANE